MSNEPDKLGPPPVEPMTPQAWSRVERGIWSRIDADEAPRTAPPSRRLVWFAAPLLVAAAAMAIFVATRRDEPPLPAYNEPSRVVASDTATTVSYGDAHITVEPHAAMTMRDERIGPGIAIEEGAVQFVVAPRARKSPFTVRAGGVVVRVIGTEFRVARFAEHVEVSVEHGIVDVQFEARTSRVGAGQRWTSETPTKVEETAPVKTVKTEPPPTTDADRAKFEQLSALEARDPKAALAGYIELSRGNSAWASVALFAAGRLAADKHDANAKMLLDAYLRRFPGGANAGDARDLLTRIGAR